MTQHLAPQRLFAVLVIYERGLSEVQAWPWLRDALTSRRDCELSLARLLIYDNSPQARIEVAALPPGIDYVHDPDNGGTAAAYSKACAMAIAAEIPWLLLLDHDTSLPEDYLEAAEAARLTAGPAVRALVPRAMHGDRMISPARVTAFGRLRPIALHERLPADAVLTAIASGSLIYAQTLYECLPLPRGLWLDYVDHWFFVQLHRNGHAVKVMNAVLQHDLSIEAVDTLSSRRLTGILDGEAIFLSGLGWRARALYPLRLFARTARYAAVRPDLARQLLLWLGRRLGSR
jgi:hypothetical protein